VPGKKEFGLSAHLISFRGPSGALANCTRRSIGTLRTAALILPVALDGVPGHGKGARILDVNVRLQGVALLDQVEALDHVKLRRVRRSKSVDRRPIIEANRVNDERAAFVMTDWFAIPGYLDVRGMLVRQGGCSARH
jgi:hypothetical protein